MRVLSRGSRLLRPALVLVILLSVGLPLGSVASVQTERVSADSTEQSDKYWIFFANRPAPASDVDADLQPVAPSFLDALQAQGILPIVHSRWFHAVSARIDAAQRDWLRCRDFVRSLRPVRAHRTTSATTPRSIRPAPERVTPTDSLAMGRSRGPLSRINAVSPLERGLNGRGVRIGFLDAHFRGLRHSAFARLRRDNRMIALRNFTEGLQSGNHGSAVASVTLGRDPGSLIGPAWGADMLGATTEYTPSERNVEEDYFVAGLEWLHRRGADVVNVSVGYNTFDEGQDSYTVEDLDGDTGITTVAVDRAAQQGMVVVVSAGNSGCASPDSCWYYVNTPADADSAITVGAVGPDSTIASFSSRGPTADGRRKPDVVVQGEKIVAAWKNGGYARVGGTSFASPQVTGIVAQMLQVNPDLSPMEVRHILRHTASQAQNPDNRMGWGIVNAERALRAAERRARLQPPSTLVVETPDVRDGTVTLPLRVPDATPTIDLSVRSSLGTLVATRTVHVHPGPNWISLELPAGANGLYAYRLRTNRTVKRGVFSVPPM